MPATPGTIAWPPSLPSVPTSRATRVTSEANDRSWSTIVLMASLSCRISPRTSTVIFLERSPSATAMVTSAMLRTWAVRLLAIRFTLSVRSFQTPLTSWTCACPPSLPSVPTSRATRVTSDVNTPSWRIIVLTIGRRPQELALERPAVDVEPDRLEQVALGHRRERRGHFGRGPEQVVDQRIDRRLHLTPGAAGAIETSRAGASGPHGRPNARPAPARSDAGVGGRDVVEGVGNLAVQTRPVGRQANRELAIAHGEQRAEQFVLRIRSGGRQPWALHLRDDAASLLHQGDFFGGGHPSWATRQIGTTCTVDRAVSARPASEKASRTLPGSRVVDYTQ